MINATTIALLLLVAVVETIDRESIVLIDPSVGRLKYRSSAFEEQWNGIELCVSDKRESLLRQKF